MPYLEKTHIINVYNITDTVPAHSVKKVNGPISYCLSNIPVTLSPSISRFGQKSRRKLSFLVRKGQMLKFIYSDCEKVGLLQNKRETNIREKYSDTAVGSCSPIDTLDNP